MRRIKMGKERVWAGRCCRESCPRPWRCWMLPFLGGKESGGPVHTWWCKACFVPTALGSSLPPGETEESRGRVMGKGFALKQPQQQCPNPLPTTRAQAPSLVHGKMRSGWAHCCLVGKSPHSSRLWMQTRSEELLIKPRLAEECKTRGGEMAHKQRSMGLWASPGAGCWQRRCPACTKPSAFLPSWNEHN